MEDEYEEERLLLQQQHNREEQTRDVLHGNQQSYSGFDSFSLYEAMRSGASNFNTWKDNLNLDPWAVFEDFFFQESNLRNEPTGTEEFRSSEQPYGHQRYQHSQSRQHVHPPRVSEQTMYRGFDPGYGANVYTVLRREDYIHDARNSDGKYFYQILGQDFVSGKIEIYQNWLVSYILLISSIFVGTQVDPYTGFTLREYYSAVTEPYLVEEGYSNKDDSYDTHDGQSQERKSSHKQRESIHKLEQGESITPNRSHAANQWISPNGKYEAVLSQTCELQVYRHDKSDDGTVSTIVWSTETYIPHNRAKGCNLTLNTLGQLVLSVDYGSGLGSAAASNTVLWSSPVPAVVPHLFHEENGEASISFHYYASLDNDGVVAVYRIQTNDTESSSATQRKTTKAKPANNGRQSSSENKGKEVRPGQSSKKIPQIVERLSLMYHRLSKASVEQEKTKAALAWDHLRFKVGRVLKSRPMIAGDNGNRLSPGSGGSYEEKSQSGDEVRRAECVYSTSPVGCLTPGRNAIHLSRTFATKIKDSLKTLDSKFDEFLTHLTEEADDYESSFMYEDDEDDDILDTLIRVTGAAGAKGMQLGKAGVHAAQIGLKHGRRAAGKVVGKMKDRVGKQSVRWNERTTEKEDVDSYF